MPSRAPSLAPKSIQTSNFEISSTARRRCSIPHNATTDTPQLGLIAPAPISNPLAHPARSTQCRHAHAILHERARHQIHIWPQTRPLRTPPRHASLELYIDGGIGTESAFDAPA